MDVVSYDRIDDDGKKKKIQIIILMTKEMTLMSHKE